MRVVKWLPILVVALFLLPPATAVGAPAVTADEIEQEAESKVQDGTQYVVLLDTSSRLYLQYKDDLLGFIGTVRPADRLNVIAFDSTIRDVPPALPGLPRTPTTEGGRGSDIGAAIAQAVSILGGSDFRSAAQVVLVSDGSQDASGQYPLSDDLLWTALRNAVGALRQPSVSAYTLGNHGSEASGLMTRVFGAKASVIQPGALTQRVAAVWRAKAKQLLANDRYASLTIQWPEDVLNQLAMGDKKTTIAVRMWSAAVVVPMTVSGVEVHTFTTGFPLKARLVGGPVELPPGLPGRLVRVELSWTPPPASGIGTEKVSRIGQLQLVPKLSLPWSDVLRTDFGLTVEPTLVTSTESYRVTGRVGNAYVEPVLWAVALALIAVLLMWWIKVLARTYALKS